MNEKVKAKALWIPPEEAPSERPWCDRCKTVRMRYYDDAGYFCSQCGKKYEAPQERDTLTDEYSSNPMIGKHRKNGKEKRPADFPMNAEILSDVETSSVDGSETEIEY